MCREMHQKFQVSTQCIEQDNPVRFIEAFVAQLDLAQLSYVTTSLKPQLPGQLKQKILDIYRLAKFIATR